MKIIKFLFLSAIVVVALLAGAGFLLPSKAHVERSIKINASPEIVFSSINSMQAFNQWSPWVEKDPKTKYQFSGPDHGVGSTMSWQSDHPNVGSGTQKIIESVKNSSVKTQLDFSSQGSATAYLNLADDAGKTQVTWGFDSEFGYNIIARYFGLMFDRWIGPEYEKGLVKLKSISESKVATTGP